MRLRILKDGSWELARMRDVEFYFLRQIRSAADSGDCDGARKRLFPESATAAGETTEGVSEDGTRDWRELVVPELTELFRDAVSRVEEDLEGVEIEEGKGGGRTYRLRIPAEHAEQWYSALNQGRLVLAERFNLPMSEADFVGGNDIMDERWLAFAQSNVYAFIQSFLLETVMESPG